MGRPIFHDSYEHWQSGATVRRNSAYVYDLWQKGHSSSVRKTPDYNKNLGSISRKSKARIQKYVELLFDASKQKRVYYKKEQSYFFYKIGFITLTLPSLQIHSDADIYKECFKPFLRQIKSKRADFLYLWKAECQDNGNLHFHITTNSFLHYSYVRDVWNRCCNRLGYVDRCAVENPPSTDIRAVKNEKTLAIYLSKYLSKKDTYKRSCSLNCAPNYAANKGNGVLVCDIKNRWQYELKRQPSIKLWDCSNELKACKTSALIDWEQEAELMHSHKALLFAEDSNLYVYRFGPNERKLIPKTMKIYYDAIISLRNTTQKEQSSYVLEPKFVANMYELQHD